MPLQERILVGGAPGSGKTYAWLTIARALPEHKFYVIDPDDGVRRVWYGEFPEVKNIEYYFTPKWFTKDYSTYSTKGPQVIKLEERANQAGVADAWSSIKPKIKPDDWVIVEHLHLLWSYVQDGFADEVFNKDIGKYFLEARKNMKAGANRLEALKGWTDWQVINKLHNDDFVVDVCYGVPSHVFMTTSVSSSGGGKDEDTEVKAFYGSTGVRFEGQKHNPYRAQSILIFKNEGSGDKRQYLVNTFQKDRSRGFLENEAWCDFYYDYLVGVAGWS